jgi:hypothetical protein
MPFDLRFPNITGTTPQEQLQQMKSFLYQTVEQLNFAIGTMEKESKSIVEQIRNTSAATDTPEKAQSTFNSIKSLIIKSADIVESYGDVITERLEGEYVAISDFGEYQRSTAADIVKNAKAIEQNYKNVQQITSDLLEVSNALIGVTANIKTGLLYYDDNGVPRYGLEIGERAEIDGVETFHKFARFTSDRLSFYDQNGKEVAYISDYKLVITNVEIKGNLKLGGYLYDTSNGIAHKWVGRS